MRSEGPEIEIEKRNIIDYLRAFIYLLHSFYLKNILSKGDLEPLLGKHFWVTIGSDRRLAKKGTKKTISPSVHNICHLNQYPVSKSLSSVSFFFL